MSHLQIMIAVVAAVVFMVCMNVYIASIVDARIARKKQRDFDETLRNPGRKL